MKKILLYSLMLLSTFAIFSCSDDDNLASENADRLMRPQFRTRYTVSAGSSDPDICDVKGLNTIFLSWSKVRDAVGYEIKVSTQQKVANGEAAWENPDNILFTYTVPADKDTMYLENLAYNTNYRFAIRALSDRGEAHHSQWWGYGDGQHWADYLGISTKARYSTPDIISKITDNVYDPVTGKASFRVHLNRSIKPMNKGKELDPEKDAAEYALWQTKYQEWCEHFTQVDGPEGEKVWKCDYFRITASESSPGAEVPEQFQGTNYVLTDADFERGYIDVTGLTQNSVYVIDVVDKDIPIPVDAVYNTRTKRTMGLVGDPIILNEANGYAEVDTMIMNDVVYKFSDYESVLGPNFKAIRLDKVLQDFMIDNTLAEDQVFYLEGGKTYFTTSNTDLYKGFTLKTNPEDLAAGKPKAKVYDLRCLPDPNSSPAWFMLGRQPLDGENANIPIEIDQIIFEDIDFDFPPACNSFEAAKPTGNYLFNQYSGGMGIYVENFEIRGCSFQRLVRGFGRTQCAYGEFIKNFLVENCEFYNCGGYSGNGKGYGFFTADLNNPESNCFNNMVWRNNTFFDTPIGNFLTHGTGTGQWADPSIVFNITIENNTFINFNTYASNSIMLNFRSIPMGSTFTIRKNLFVLTKAEGDERPLNLLGADIRTLDGVCQDQATFDIHDNWSTNDNISASTGEVFSASAFSANKNSFGKFSSWEEVTYPAGIGGLKIKIADISAVDLMYQPNPPVPQVGTETAHVHHTQSIDGSTVSTGVNSKIPGNANLYFKNFDNEIVANGIGAAKWRSAQSAGAKRRR